MPLPYVAIKLIQFSAYLRAIVDRIIGSFSLVVGTKMRGRMFIRQDVYTHRSHPTDFSFGKVAPPFVVNDSAISKTLL
ncbi:MAG: hypothetical protein QOI07_52 [Verrucomicrobiota bacterium]